MDEILTTGPMFAGKTTALLERVAEEEAKGLRVTLVKSCKDRRYSDDEIVSHDGTARRCNAVGLLDELHEVIGHEEWNDTDVIAVDEVRRGGGGRREQDDEYKNTSQAA